MDAFDAWCVGDRRPSLAPGAYNTAILLITHDMGAVAEMADRVMVMYAGRVIEQGTAAQVLGEPGHAYARGLIECLPELGSSTIGKDREALPEIAGMVPSIWELGSGCAFRERCPHAMERCTAEVPPMFPHGAACWLHGAPQPHKLKEAA